MEAPQESEIDLRAVADEYKIWKKNTPFLYDLVMTHVLEHPSLTVQFLQDHAPDASGEYVKHKLVLGTHAGAESQNFLMVATVTLPAEDTEIDPRKYADDRCSFGGFGALDSKVEITARIPHSGEVNRARAMPQRQSIVATKGPTGPVNVFDTSKYSAVVPEAKPGVQLPCTPDITLYGHDEEGYGLSWSHVDAGMLLSGSDDARVCLWDTIGNPSAVQTFSAHTGVVEDVAWHRHHKDLFGSVGDDCFLMIWDYRASPSRPCIKTKGHRHGINTLAFNPYQEYLLATGSADHTAALWDLRNMTSKLHSFESHIDEVFSVQWAPFNESILATSSADRRVNVWDLSKIGAQQVPEDVEDGPPELLFIHGGHTDKVADFSWSEVDDWVIASVGEDEVLQVWQMAENIYNEPEGDDPVATLGPA